MSQFLGIHKGYNIKIKGELFLRPSVRMTLLTFRNYDFFITINKTRMADYIEAVFIR